MTHHTPAEMIRSAIEALNSGAPERLADMLADDVVWHEIGNPEPVRGKAALAARMTGDARDWTITASLHDVIANDDHVVALLSASATRGGRTFDYRVAEIYHVRDGKVTERWAFSDDTAAIVAFFS
jgi:ketosteroid isomerase-like protein